MIHRQFNMIGIPERPAKPRAKGLTLMLDKGFSPRQVEDVLDMAAEYIDLVKLGWGTAVITPGLQRKLDIYREAGIPVYFGGTLFEAFYMRGQLDTYRPQSAEMEVVPTVAAGRDDVGHRASRQRAHEPARHDGGLGGAAARVPRHSDSYRAELPRRSRHLRRSSPHRADLFRQIRRRRPKSRAVATPASPR